MTLSFWLDHFLDSRAEIHQIFALSFFSENWRHQSHSEINWPLKSAEKHWNFWQVKQAWSKDRVKIWTDFRTVYWKRLKTSPHTCDHILRYFFVWKKIVTHCCNKIVQLFFSTLVIILHALKEICCRLHIFSHSLAPKISFTIF